MRRKILHGKRRKSMRDKRRKLSSSWTEFYVLAAHSSSGSGYVFLIGFTLEYVEYRTASFVPLVALHPLFFGCSCLKAFVGKANHGHIALKMRIPRSQT